eukprot:gb/GEZN01000599.1/.p1 GENE.gb/GEZN01000599.1/~~gb/GEZN01000599.1/.p1  ORF type:complete len:1265 (+),score=317.01 gb/GEZN01000599.1/:306-3797(+)
MANSEEFVEAILEYLLSRLAAEDKAVRYRCCQLIASVLSSLPEEAELSEELFEQIVEGVLPCTKDKVPQVRLQAVAGLVRMQDCEDPEDDVLTEYLRLLSTDSSPLVRAAVLQHITISRVTLPECLKRTRDVHDTVRQTAFDMLREKVSLRSLRILQRIQLLRAGLRDRAANVKTACIRLVVDSWLRSSEDDVVKLLECLDVETYTEEAELLLSILFAEGLDKGSNTPKPPLAAELLTPESVIYWRCLLDYYRKQNKVSELEEAMMDTVELCELIKTVARLTETKATQLVQEEEAEAKASQLFVVQQVLKVAKYADVQDEVGRAQLSSLARELVCSLECDPLVVPPALDILESMFRQQGQNETSFVQSVLELLADVRDPLEATDESGDARDSREKLEQRLESLETIVDELVTSKLLSVQQENYEAAAELQKQLVVTKQERQQIEAQLGTALYQGSATWHRLLSIVTQLLQRTSRPLAALPGLAGLLDDSILPGLALPEVSLRLLATQALGLFCLLDKMQARKNLPLIVKAMCTDVAEVQLGAVRTVFDLLLLYPDLLQSEDNSSGAASDALLEPLTVYLEIGAFQPSKNKSQKDAKQQKVEVTDLRALCVEGFAKLLTLGRLDQQTAGVVLSKLLLLHFHPDTESAPSVRQCLSVFFPTYVASDAVTALEQSASHRGVLRGLFMGIVREVSQARRGSTLKQVEFTKLCQYMVFLLDYEAPSGSTGHTLHEELALECLCYLLARPGSAAVEPVSRTLASLNIRKEAQEMIKKMRFILAQVLEVVSDKSSLRYLNKVCSALERLDEDPDKQLTEEARRLLEETIHFQTEKLEEHGQDGNQAAKKPIVPKKNRKEGLTGKTSNKMKEDVDEKSGPEAPAENSDDEDYVPTTSKQKAKKTKTNQKQKPQVANKQAKKKQDAEQVDEEPASLEEMVVEENVAKSKRRQNQRPASKTLNQVPEKQKQDQKQKSDDAVEIATSQEKKMQRKPASKQQRKSKKLKKVQQKKKNKRRPDSGSEESDQESDEVVIQKDAPPVTGRPRRGAAALAAAKMKKLQEEEVEQEIEDILSSSSEDDEQEELPPRRTQPKTSPKKVGRAKGYMAPTKSSVGKDSSGSKKNKKPAKQTEEQRAKAARAKEAQAVANDIQVLLSDDSEEVNEGSDSEYVDE